MDEQQLDLLDEVDEIDEPDEEIAAMPIWVVVHQDLKTLECKRCGGRDVLPVTLPIKLDYYTTLLKQAGKTFGVYHAECEEPSEP